jgi:hypothetical protein
MVAQTVAIFFKDYFRVRRHSGFISLLGAKVEHHRVAAWRHFLPNAATIIT